MTTEIIKQMADAIHYQIRKTSVRLGSNRSEEAAIAAFAIVMPYIVAMREALEFCCKKMPNDGCCHMFNTEFVAKTALANLPDELRG